MISLHSLEPPGLRGYTAFRHLHFEAAELPRPSPTQPFLITGVQCGVARGIGELHQSSPMRTFLTLGVWGVTRRHDQYGFLLAILVLAGSRACPWPIVFRTNETSARQKAESISSFKCISKKRS